MKKLKKAQLFIGIFLCWCVFMSVFSVRAETINSEDAQVNDISVTSNKDLCQVEIDLSKSVDYKISELKDKNFLILDIFNANYNLQRSTQDVMNTFINKIRSSQYELSPSKIVRIVFELEEMLPYRSEKTNKGINLVIEKSGKKNNWEKDKKLEIDRDKEKADQKKVKESNGNKETDTAKGIEEMNVGDNGLVTMSFRDADLNDVLRMFSYKAGANIVAGDEVKGKITLRLVDVPWEQALKTILRANGLTYIKEDGGIIWVASAEKINAELQVQSQAQVQVKEDLAKLKAVEEVKPAVPLQNKTITLSYADIEEVKNVIQKILSERGSIIVDKRMKSMIISDIPENMKKIEDMAAIFDKRTPQVTIQSMLIEISSKDSKNLGINWGNSSGTSGGISTVNPSGRVAVDAGLLPAMSGTSNITVGTVVDNVALNVALRAMLSQGTTELLASPKVATLDNQNAMITIGKKVSLRLLDEEGRPVTKLVPIGIKLEVKPHITADGHISMEIRPEVSYIEPNPVSRGEIEINTTEAQTIVMVVDSQTAVIGGLIRKDISQSEEKVPILGNIPFLGFFFKSKANENNRKELLIFVTPHIITDEEMTNEAILGLKRMEDVDLEKTEEELAREKSEKKSGKNNSKEK